MDKIKNKEVAEEEVEELVVINFNQDEATGMIFKMKQMSIKQGMS